MLFVFVNHIVGQSQQKCLSGVFLSANDFVHDRLSLAFNSYSKGYKFHFTFPADMSLTLKLVTPDTTYKFKPGTIYGYEDCGNVFRFFSGGKELNAQEDFYKIEDGVEGFIIYSSAFVSGSEIFYSTSLTAPIHRLTVRSLRRDFVNYPGFLYEVKKLKRHTNGLVSKNDDEFVVMSLFKKFIYRP